MPIKRIYFLPVALQEYKTVRLNGVSGHCYVCHRDYDQKDDPEDPHEVACAPLQLVPCGHLIGSECLKATTSRGMHNCALCQTPMDVKIDPFDIRTVVASCVSKSKVVRFDIDQTLRLGMRLASEGTSGNRLHTRAQHDAMVQYTEEVFAQQATSAEAATLWYYYTKLYFLQLVLTFTTLASPFQQAFTSLTVLSIIDLVLRKAFASYLIPMQLQKWSWISLVVSKYVSELISWLALPTHPRAWNYKRIIYKLSARYLVLRFTWICMVTDFLFRFTLMVIWLAVTISCGVRRG